MKRYANLWQEIIRWDNLVLAAQKAQRGKRDRLSVQTFNFNQECELLKLQQELQSQSYHPGPFTSHWIYTPKKRLISVAPYRDRVVHHALLNILEPILDRHFHPHSYACRKGKGAHAAAARLQKLMHHHKYALQCDIRKFFPSIDHDILKETFRRLIKDARTLRLMDTIVDSSNPQPSPLSLFPGDDLFTHIERRVGLPIGNLTSQWFANWMLNDLDHLLTSKLQCGAYLRYCDDFILLQNDRQLLKGVLQQIRGHLETKRLKVHDNKVFIRPVQAGITFVGFRIRPTHILLKKDNVVRFRRRVRWMRQAYTTGLIDWDHIRPRLDSWMAHARHADTRQLVQHLSRQWTFKRAETVNVPRYSRRQLEQQREQLARCQPQQQHAVESQQQHRVSFGPALSTCARNCMVHGPCECGPESPGFIPEPPRNDFHCRGRINAVRPVEAGRAIRTSRPAISPLLRQFHTDTMTTGMTGGGFDG